MTLLVTGATGFVMSVLARHWLDAFPNERVAVRPIDGTGMAVLTDATGIAKSFAPSDAGHHRSG